MSDNGEEPLYVKLPPSLKFLVDEEDDSNKDVVIAALEQYLGVSKDESEAVIRRKIKRKEKRFEALRDELEETRGTVQQTKDDIERLRDILESKEDHREAYRDRLDKVLDVLESGSVEHVFPEHARVRDIAQEFDRSRDEVLYDLKDRAVEQNRDLYNTNFMDTYENAVEKRPIEGTFHGGGAE